MGEADQPSRARRRKPTPQFTWEDAATATLPVLACFLGGATEKWAEGVIVALLGVMLLFNPPRFTLGLAVNGIMLALLACAVLAYLPATWFARPEWRAAMVDDFGIQLGSTVSPQPWVTAGCLLSFFAGLCWFYYVAGGDIEIRAARRQLRIFSLSVIGLAALAIVLHLAHTALPFWHNQRNFGPFPNRNQTANLFGITAVVILACAHDDIRRSRKTWPLWLGGLAVVIAALVLNFSRAGILILLVGTGAWGGLLALRSRSLGRIAIAASAVLVLVTVLLVFGGQTLERFNLRGAAGATVTADFRWLIFQDAWRLIRASPWCGVGLGNFQPVFALFREASLGQTRALHPESDWLWLWAELGWPAVLLIIAGAAVLIRKVFPLSEGTNHWFRTAALIGAVLFALHGLVDVGGHRVGSAYAGLFLFGLAQRRPMPWPASHLLTNTFRIAGVLLMVIGVTWVAAVYRGSALPGGIGVDRERHLATTANTGSHYDESIARATEGLQWAPLDWQLYFLRALGKVSAKRPPTEAADDFRRARFLEPSSFEVPYQEGLAWLMPAPTLAMNAWREALHRAGAQRPELYDRMLSSASQRSAPVNRMLQQFGASEHDLALTLLGRAKGEDFNATLTRLLENDPALERFTLTEKEKLFYLWSERGDAARLLAFIHQNPESLATAWRSVAKLRADKRDFAGACDLARQFSARPAMPQALSVSGSIADLQHEIFANASNYGVAFALYQQQMESGRAQDALITIRRITEQPACPAYFHFLEAEAWAAKSEFERAWTAWLGYERASAAK